MNTIDELKSQMNSAVAHKRSDEMAATLVISFAVLGQKNDTALTALLTLAKFTKTVISSIATAAKVDEEQVSSSYSTILSALSDNANYSDDEAIASIVAHILSSTLKRIASLPSPENAALEEILTETKELLSRIINDIKPRK